MQHRHITPVIPQAPEGRKEGLLREDGQGEAQLWPEILASGAPVLWAGHLGGDGARS